MSNFRLLLVLSIGQALARHIHGGNMRLNLQGFAMRAMVALAILFTISSAHSRPVLRAHKGGALPQTLLRQMNTVSNVEFSYTNRGELFSAGTGNNEGLFWPRGSGDSYIFGGGLWFATQKEIQGKLQKLCELGYNANSGAGWYIEGEASQVGLSTGTDGANDSAKYISYVSPRYDATVGKFIPGSSTVVPSPYYSWPMWDTSSSKTFKHNYYFGDYISDVTMRNAASIQSANSQLGIIGKTPLPAMVSQEDIVNLYTDQDPTNNPEFKPGTGYPFGLDIQEVIYSWGYGSYRDMIFVRYKVTNNTNQLRAGAGDTLLDCWLAPAFDPDLDASVGGAVNDAVSYVDDSLVNSFADSTMVSQLSQPYRSDPSKLNMAVAWRNLSQPPNGKQYGWLGISFLESPVIDLQDNIIPNDDSSGLQGYGPNSLFQKNQLGLVTFRDWTILNDPSTPDLRYDFVSSGEKDVWNGVYQDQRMMMSTGPFTLPPGKSAEATVALTFARVSDTSYKQNFGALLLLTELAHQVFGEVDSNGSSYFVNNFQVSPPSSVKNAETVTGLTMEQPYPNPFSTNCSLIYQNSVAGAASAVVTDVLGREVESISLGEVSAGEHTLTIDGADLPAGAYRVTVTIGNEAESQMTIHIP